MAHIVDGVLSAPVLIGGAAMAVAGIALGLKSINQEHIPRVGVMSAAFFVASLIHVPIGPSSAHLIMNGLMGVVLGWAAVPAIFVGLLLQAVFFGYGGITVLGVNTVVMALPAVACFYLFAPGMRSESPFVWGAAAGAGAIVLTSAIVGVALGLSGSEFLPVAKWVIVAHLPVMAIEAAVTGAVAVLLQKAKPEMLSGPP